MCMHAMGFIGLDALCEKVSHIRDALLIEFPSRF